MHGPHQSEPEKLRKISLWPSLADDLAFVKSVSQELVVIRRVLNKVINRIRILASFQQI
jgi:hypothetical protein